MTTPQVPTRITILAILSIIAGVIGGLGGLASVAEAIGFTDSGESEFSGSVFIALSGIVMLMLTLLNFAFGLGALELKPWAWNFGVALQSAGVIVGLSQLFHGTPVGTPSVIVGIVINFVVLYYLSKPNVKRTFGRV